MIEVRQMNKKEICQACGKELVQNDDVIRIQYGRLSRNLSLFAVMGFPKADYFHLSCHALVAIRTVQGIKNTL